MAPKKIVILGTSGNSQDILDTINDVNTFSTNTSYRCIGFLDDSKTNWGREFQGVKVLGPLTDACKYSDCLFVNGIGNPSNFFLRKKIVSKTKIPEERFASIIHPSASVSRTAMIGQGIVVLQNVTITTNVSIGNHVAILPNSVISHDTVIGNHTIVAGGVCVSGNVRVGESCYLGTRSALIGDIAIGDNCLVGMGAVVLKSVNANSVVGGNPARFLRETIN